jgi:hypothetical protein
MVDTPKPVKFTLPTFYCPLPTRYHEPHPYAEDAEHELFEVLDKCNPAWRHGDTVRGISPGRYLGPCYHDASRDGLLVGLLYCTFFYLWDDWLDERTDGGQPVRTMPELAAFCDRASDIMTGAPARDVDHPLLQLLQHLFRAIADYDPGWDQRWFRWALEHYMRGQLWELHNITHGVTPPFEEYVTLRKHAGGQYPAVELDRLIYRLDIPDRVRYHPAVAHAHDAAVAYPLWQNDVFSYPREYLKTGNVGSTNLVVVMRQELGCSDQEAINAAAVKVDGLMRTYLSVRDRLPKLGVVVTDDLMKWLARCETWMALDLAYHQVMPRYDLAAGFHGVAG